MFKKIVVIFIIAGGIFYLLFMNKNSNQEENILFSWHMTAINDKKLISVLKKYNINVLYQEFSTSYLEGQDNAFLKKMQKNNITVYHLSGDPSWGIDIEGKQMMKEIDKVVHYNNNQTYHISGLVFDVEPYIDNLDGFDLELYTKIMKKVYKYAQSNHLYMILVIPYWFDKLSEVYLEELIQNGCDEVSIMNYKISNTKNNIKEEILYAKKYNKSINTIYEVNFGAENTFSSYEQINDDYNDIYNYYQYKKLKKAYHYYDLLEI